MVVGLCWTDGCPARRLYVRGERMKCGCEKRRQGRLFLDLGTDLEHNGGGKESVSAMRHFLIHECKPNHGHLRGSVIATPYKQGGGLTA